MSLTVVYVTYRRDCHVEWFLDSLRHQLDGDPLNVVIVDHYQKERDWSYPGYIKHVAPKPSVWQGPTRLTKEDYFAASNARNTGLCYAPDGWIAYVDDLSVLLPGWLKAVREAMAGNYIVLGAYKKVKQLNVVNGEVVSFEEFPAGVDSRWDRGKDDGPVIATGSWMFGCSCAMPVEALLACNGWPEHLCDGGGGEDYICGMAMAANGYPFRYDRRMLTYESEEHHHTEKPLKRSDYGVSPKDKSHKSLELAMELKEFVNFSHGSIRDLRAKILAGEPFPVPTMPDKEWFTGIPLGELP